MKILVNDKNKERINTILDEAQGRATSRTVTYGVLVNVLKSVDYKYSGLTKKQLKGTELTLRPYAFDQPKAYKHEVALTEMTVYHNGKEWVLTGVERKTFRGVSKTDGIVVKLPEETIKAMMKEHLFAITHESYESRWDMKGWTY